MRSLRFRTIIVGVLIGALNYAQLAPCFAGEHRAKVPVAFVGVQFEGFDADMQKKIFERIAETLGYSDLAVLAPAEVAKQLGEARVAAFFQQPDSAAYRAIAEALHVRYVIAGSLANQSRDAKRALLVGELRRFDHPTNLWHRFEVLKYYDTFGVEVLRFKEEYVKTMLPQEASGTGSWGWLVIAGITVVGVVALTAGVVKIGGSGDSSDSGGPRP